MEKSASVSLVKRDQVVEAIRFEVGDDDSMSSQVASRRRVPQLEEIATKALVVTNGDTEKAIQAVVIVKGNVNRLSQCGMLLETHRREIVRVAYELHDELLDVLAGENVALIRICEMLEYTDGDLEGEVTRLMDLLKHIAEISVSPRQKWFFFFRVIELLEEGRMLESIEELIEEDLERHCWKGDE